MSRRLADACLAVVLVLGCHQQGHAGDGSGDLKSNPFDQPAPVEKVPVETPAAVNVLELRGIMIAGSRSQANIGGVIISIGEEIDGYKLLSVKPQHVVLVKNGVQKILAVDARDRSTKK
jgi:hypothetical protein